MLPYFQRMIDLAEKTFAAKSDPRQLDVDQNVITNLKKIHPNLMSEHKLELGPVAWILLIPASQKSMNEFLKDKINENDLYKKAIMEPCFEAIYLCSALVLEEFRRNNLASKLTTNAINEIKKDYEIKYLFAWTFSFEGQKTAEKISSLLNIPLFIKNNY